MLAATGCHPELQVKGISPRGMHAPPSLTSPSHIPFRLSFRTPNPRLGMFFSRWGAGIGASQGVMCHTVPSFEAARDSMALQAHRQHREA